MSKKSERYYDEYEDDFENRGRKPNKNKDRQDRASKKRTDWWESDTYKEEPKRNFSK